MQNKEVHSIFNDTMLDGISKTDLTIIKTESGSIFHAIKNTDAGFREFGEVHGAYSSWSGYRLSNRN